MAKQLKAIKCPSDELSFTNCAIVNPKEFEKVRYIVQKASVINKLSLFVFNKIFNPYFF